MKQIKFRPLRLNKDNKVIVSNYMSWRRLKTADYSQFELTLYDDHLSLPKDALVHNHKGEVLFFYSYNPYDMPSKPYGYLHCENVLLRELNEDCINGLIVSENSFYSVKGVDCDFIPTFTHYTKDYISSYMSDLKGLEPLTVQTVVFQKGVDYIRKILKGK